MPPGAHCTSSTVLAGSEHDDDLWFVFRQIFFGSGVLAMVQDHDLDVFHSTDGKNDFSPEPQRLSLCVIPVPYATYHYTTEQELQAPFLDCSSRTQGRRSLQTSSLGANDAVPALASAVLDRFSGHGWKQAHGPPCAAHPDRCGTFLA